MNVIHNEFNDSQKPALRLLNKLGSQYLASQETEEERGRLLPNVVQERGLVKQLLQNMQRCNLFQLSRITQ